MGDGEDLVALSELAELGADGGGGLAADAGVYLVEDVGGAGLDALLGERLSPLAVTGMGLLVLGLLLATVRRG